MTVRHSGSGGESEKSVSCAKEGAKTLSRSLSSDQAVRLYDIVSDVHRQDRRKLQHKPDYKQSGRTDIFCHRKVADGKAVIYI